MITKKTQFLILMEFLLISKLIFNLEKQKEDDSEPPTSQFKQGMIRSTSHKKL